jgi:hypothetical protein
MSELKEKIQQWVIIDNQSKLINEKTREIRNKKNELLSEISEYVKKNNIQNKTIEITDGSLKFYEKKEYSGLTYSYIEESLGKIIQDKNHVDHIMNYLHLFTFQTPSFLNIINNLKNIYYIIYDF